MYCYVVVNSADSMNGIVMLGKGKPGAELVGENVRVLVADGLAVEPPR